MANLPDRLSNIARFAEGTHPFLQAAFYDPKQTPLEAAPPITHRTPRFSFPNELTPIQKQGDEATEALFARYGETGGPILIHNGFNLNIETEIGLLPVLIDTNPKVDPLLAGIVSRAKELFKTNPNWSTSRQVFELGLLSFGNWGQLRAPLKAFESYYPPKFVLGEIAWTTQVQDLSCALLSLTTQVVGQASGLDISWHQGTCARFSPHCHGSDEHGWNTVKIDDLELIVDWTNFPPQLDLLLASAATTPHDRLYKQFCKSHGGFSQAKKELYPPSNDDYLAFQCGEKQGLSSRNSAVYRSYQGEYLYSCDLPWGWDSSL